MANKELSLNKIKPPTFYIRGDVKEDHVKDLIDVVRNNPAKEWPFDDPLIVRPLDTPEPCKRTMSGESGKVEYELIAGMSRSLALVACKRKNGLCEVRNFKTDADALLAQYEADDHPGLKLDRDARGRFIVEMRDTHKLTLRQIGEKIGLDESSVSRILRGLQAHGKTGQRAGQKKKPKKKKKKNGATGNGKEVYTAAYWFEMLAELVELFGKHRADILAHRSHADPALFASAHDAVTVLVESEERV